MILITGGAGYIGSHTLDEFLKQGLACVVFDNFSTGHRQAVPEQVPVVQGDLRAPEDLKKVFNTYDITAVVHFAAVASVGESVQEPLFYYQNNVQGTLNLLAAMKEHQVNKIVFSSSCAVYGNPRYLPLDEKHPIAPVSPYGRTKAMIEKVFADCHTAYGLKYIALRYFNAAGASKDGHLGESHHPETHLIPCILSALHTGKEVCVFGTDYDTADGTALRDYVHVSDLARAHYLALQNDDFSGCLNLGTGQGTTVLQMIAAAEKVVGVKAKVQYRPRRLGDASALYACPTQVQQVLGWQPQWTDIAEIIHTADEWFMHKGY